MGYLYWFIIITAVLIFLTFLIKFPRQGILAGLTFTTFSLEALPWHLLPVRGVAFSTQMCFVILSLIFFLCNKKDIRGSLRAIFNRYLIVLLVFIIIMVMFLLVSQNQGYGQQKCLIFVIKIIVPLFAFSFLAPLDEDALKIFIITIIAGSLLTTMNLFSYGNITLERGVIENFCNPITMSRTIGLGTLLLLLSFLNAGILCKKNRYVYYIVAVPVFCAMLFSMLLTGSRGPLLFVFIAFIFIFVFYIRQIRWSWSKTLILALCFIIFAVAIPKGLRFTNIEFPSISRITHEMNSMGNNPSDISRIKMFATAIDIFLDSKALGVGTGGYLCLYNNVKYMYPHNLFLEVAAEQGMVGVMILLSSVYIACRRFVELMKSKNKLCNNFLIINLFALWLYAFFNSLVSMDVSGNYYFWIFGGLIMLVKYDHIMYDDVAIADDIK